ncbi:MAG: Crp/Fnr family transcriptional regulator [Gammaproteobacteria bacterium]
MLDLAQETDLLRKIPMFAKLNASKLKLLAFTSELVTYEPGEVIFFAGDLADSAFVIMEGAVDVVTETDSGTLVSLTLQQNQLFGELALLSNAPRSATLKASGKATVMKITAEMFLKLLCENSDLALDVMRQLSDKLAKSHHQVEDLQRQLEQRSSAT